MISQRRFLEQMSKPYGLELFLKRSLNCLYRFSAAEVLNLKGETPIVEAVRCSLQRPAEDLYEPIVVELEAGMYQLLDVHQLLVAHSKIHELTGAVHVAEAIRQAVRALQIPHENSLGSWCVTLSLGVAGILPTPEELPSTLIAAADAALYQAKSLGRDRVLLHPFLSQLPLHQ